MSGPAGRVAATPADTAAPGQALAINRVRLSGVLVERKTLRFTPAGIAMLEAGMSHRSEALEAGHRRTLEFDVALVFAGALAARADRLPLGGTLSVEGFLAPRRRHSKSLVLHVTAFAEPAAAADAGVAERDNEHIF